MLEAEAVLELVHDYPDKRVRLDVWHVRRYRGLGDGARGAAAALGYRRECRELALLEADWPIVARLPIVVRVTSSLGRRAVSRSRAETARLGSPVRAANRRRANVRSES